jgi:hypothetical protein
MPVCSVNFVTKGSTSDFDRPEYTTKVPVSSASVPEFVVSEVHWDVKIRMKAIDTAFRNEIFISAV